MSAHRVATVAIVAMFMTAYTKDLLNRCYRPGFVRSTDVRLPGPSNGLS